MIENEKEKLFFMYIIFVRLFLFQLENGQGRITQVSYREYMRI